MLDKIRKLLALAADPSCQGAEAETAARQVAMDEAFGIEREAKSSRLGRGVGERALIVC